MAPVSSEICYRITLQFCRAGVAADRGRNPRASRVSKRRLREEIRITLLHELAHYHGLTEDELDELGYG